MAENEDSGSPSWSTSFFTQTSEDVARAVAAAAATVHSPRPSVVFSSRDDNSNTPLKKLQHQVSKVLKVKGFSNNPEVKSRTYNPEVLTSQKRQWASFQLQSLDHRRRKVASRLFESMVVVGLHPNCDIQALQRQYFNRKSEGSGKFRSALSGQHQSRVEPNIEPQVLFVYPPEKQLPLKYKDLLSFCFPGGLEVHAVEKTPSMSELNEILLGQEHIKKSDLSFVFRLKVYLGVDLACKSHMVADDSTLYGCCVLVDEIVQKPSGLISMISDGQPLDSGLSRHILTTRRCYCILSRLPFFQLHFGILNSIFTEERLNRLTKGFMTFDLEPTEVYDKEEGLMENFEGISLEYRGNDMPNGTVNACQLNSGDCHRENQRIESSEHSCDKHEKAGVDVTTDAEMDKLSDKRESGPASSSCSDNVDSSVSDKQPEDRCLPSAVLPLLWCQHNEGPESPSSFQGSPCEERNVRSDFDEFMEEASFSGQGFSNDHSDVLEWAKANNHGSLQIICEYYRLHCPTRGSRILFHPLEHLHPLEFRRPDETVLHIAGSKIDLKSCRSSLEYEEAHIALMAEEEANSLSVWAVSCLCGSLRLENVLSIFAGALLEKHIAVVCSNLGILSAIVLSIIPLIRPFQWQSLLMPVLPNDMLEFLDAPVPYIVGVKNKTNEVQSRITNAILVDANKNQVRSPTIPQLPKQKELYSALYHYHARLVGESFLGRKRPVYECTDAQVEASRGFLSVLRSYLDSLCSNLRSHTITNVQSNDDKVSLLLKESFIESFPSRDQAFMKLFVDTQLFSVHTDLVLSFFQKE